MTSSDVAEIEIEMLERTGGAFCVPVGAEPPQATKEIIEVIARTRDERRANFI